MSQSEVFHETWAYLRDNAKPIVPQDVYDLEAVRAPMPPSKAHIKRIMRKSGQPVIRVVIKRPAPDRAAREHHLQAARLGLAIKRKFRPNTTAPASPVPRPPAPPLPPAHVSAAVHDERKCKRAKRDHMIALSKMVYRTYEPDLADVIDAFGSVEAWEKAKCS